MVAADGTPVRLRGVGVGGWLNMENFITGYPVDGVLAPQGDARGARRTPLRAVPRLAARRLLRAAGRGVHRLARHELRADPGELPALGRRRVAGGDQPGGASRSWTGRSRRAPPPAFIRSSICTGPRARRTTTGIATTRSTGRCSGSTGTSRTGPSGCGRRSRAATRTGRRWRATTCSTSQPMSRARRWSDFYRRAVAAIRAVDGRHIAVSRRKPYSREFRAFGEPFENAVYAIHQYPEPGAADGGPYPGITGGSYVDRQRSSRSSCP